MKTPMRWVLAPLLGALVLALALPAAAAGPLLSEYTIFGENGVTIGFDSDIVGLVGARNNDPVAGNVAVRLNGLSTVDGDVRSGGNVNLQNQASISGTVFRPAGTTLVLNFGASVGTDAFPVDPMLPTLPPSTVFACPTGGAPISGGNNEPPLILTPGSYGAVNFGAGFDLVLNGGGNYFFDSINGGNGSTITVTQPGTKVFVCGAATWGSVNVTTSNSSPCDFYLETKATGNNAFLAGGNSNWIGDVFAPLGEIHIGSGGSVGSFIGRFFSNLVDIEHAIAGGSVNCGTPPGNEEEFRSNKDATILHTRKNQNNGAALTLRTENQTRSLVAFDVTLVDISMVKSAKLVLTVSDNGFDVPPFSPSSGWPMGGGQTFVARLDDGFEDWAEGNGNNYPIPNNPKGTGSGVTWNCSTDTNIANEKPDCTGIFRWKTGGKKHQGPLRGPALHTDGMLDGTKVVFDVTPDVLAGFGAQDNQFMTWFILVKGAGSVAYYSREGAAAAGNLDFAPILIIEE